MEQTQFSQADREQLIHDVATALSRNGYMHFLDLEKLRVISLNEKIHFIEEEMYSIEESPESYLQILPYSDAARQALRRQFIQNIGEPEVYTKLNAAVNSYDPSAAYKRVLKQYNDIAQQWHEFRETHFIAQAKKWLYENGLGAFIGKP
ncbi:MAG: hypothetical protein IPL33_03275 [Sphingobacteriales bacterium]|nr:hypothetical protein [Sphingobacteriales bacterium]